MKLILVCAASAAAASAPGRTFRAARLTPTRSGETMPGAPLALDAPGWGRGVGVGTGGRLWPCAATLARYLRDHPGLARGARVLELGCGTGAVGLYCASRLGAADVMLTDGGRDALLELARRNAAAVAAAAADGGGGCAPVAVARHRWGRRDDAALDGEWGLVVGADVTYYVNFHAKLCASLAALLAAPRPPRVLLAHQHRALAALLACGVDASSDDAMLARFADAAAAHGLAISTLRTERLAWHGLQDISVLEVTRVDGG